MRLRRWRRSHRWVLVLGAWALSSGLAIAGLCVALAEPDNELGVDDAIFEAMSIFTSPEIRIENPPELLSWARVAAAAALLMAAEGTAVMLFREPVDRFWASRRHHHVVVCGLGASGSRLAESFADQGTKVVVVDNAPGVTAAEHCRDRGVPVIIGDACDEEILRAAGIGRARHLLLFCGEDGVNATVAMAAARVVEGRPGPPLRCTLHIDDPALCQLLVDSQLALQMTASPGSAESRSVSPGMRLHFFSPGGSVGPPLLAAYPPFDDKGNSGQGKAPHILIVGLGAVGEGLIVQAARTWRLLVETGSRLRITIVDRQAGSLVTALGRRHPSISQVCDFRAIDLDIADPGFPPASLAEGDPVTVAYVCVGDDALALSAALALRRSTAMEGVPLIVRTASRDGLAALLSQPMGPSKMEAFGVLDRTCRPEVVLNGPNEMLARFIHEEYLRNTPTATHGGWEELDESLRDSNRDQADQIGHKLAAVGCALVPLTDWDAELVSFTDSEVELLAQMEHERWLAERRAGGWALGAVPSDPVKRTSPYLVAWDALTDDIRDRDRVAVCVLPRLLVRAGYLCLRRQPGEVVARAIHADYVKRATRTGRMTADDPSMAEWDALPETLKASNRDQARDIETKLNAIGCAISPVTSRGAGNVSFTVAEIETMARLEHARWVAERIAAGWTSGPRDQEAKTTPYLVDWAGLTEEVRDLDRNAVRTIPEVLAEAGLAVVRVSISRDDR